MIIKIIVFHMLILRYRRILGNNRYRPSYIGSPILIDGHFRLSS